MNRLLLSFSGGRAAAEFSGLSGCRSRIHAESGFDGVFC